MRDKRLLLAAGAIVAVAAAVFAGWWFLLRSDAPPPVDLADAVAAATSEPAGTTGAPVTTAPPATTVPDGDDGDLAATTTAPPVTTVPGADDGGLTGTWTVAAGSFVGYRVEEELAQIGFTEAVGRTSELDATLEIDGASITAVRVEVDMATLQSDNRNRDNQMRSQALETDEFPLAEFRLTVPIELGEVPAEGVPISAIATGELTIHGVTNSVDVPVEAQLVADTIAVIATIPIVFADYDIDPPQSFRVLSVEDNGVIEMQLLFERV